MPKKKKYKSEKVPHARSDVLKSRRAMHIWIGNDQYVTLRSKLFLVELSIQNVINEFLDLLVEEDKRAISIMNDMLDRKRTCKLNLINGIESPSDKGGSRKTGITEEDRNTIYQYFDEENDEDA